VTRVLFDGDKAVGVEYRQGGQLKTVRCEREVILSGGAIQTPKLLMLSGIGPEDQLRSHGIAVKSKSEGVGQNLQDHLEFPAIRLCTGPYGYFGQDNWRNTIKNGLQYLLFKSGPVMSNVTEACCFVNVDEPEAEPNIQMHFVPIVFFDMDREQVKKAGATINPCVLRPKSRGELRLRSADPAAAPIIDPRYLSDPDDVRLSVAGLRQARDILSAPAFSNYVEAEEAYPGKALQSEADLAAYVRDRGKTVYHPAGTCRMGSDDMAVVDPQLRVRGIRNLRVVDNSVMPRLISGNTNATAIMIGEKAADYIRGGNLLEPATV